TTAQVRETLAGLGFPNAEVVTFGAATAEYLIRLQAISLVTEEDMKAARTKFQAAFSANEVSRFELSPGGDKLTVRFAEKVPIPEVEKAIGDVGLVLGEIVDEPSKNKRDDKTEAEESEQGAKRCEGVTCTWPHQKLHVYEINLKGVTERVMDGFRAADFGKDAKKMRSEWVGPKVGQQLRVAGISSIVYALLFIMLYIAVRFDLRFAPGAVVALIHDVMITVGVFTLARVEVTLATVAALLTIVGYSLNDTIVVFDRIRENISKSRERKLVHVINVSINETLSRTVLTSLTTLIVVVVLLTVGWKTTIRDFAFALLIGVLVGTYSSIFVASPIVVWLDRRFGKKKI
ncbi:MAG: protein translocase subunit SecF, partial [Deltaproteobacteria bacterium]|nr:protein translocase subunit SecF [Deltaproteobacteria bacterium]